MHLRAVFRLPQGGLQWPGVPRFWLMPRFGGFLALGSQPHQEADCISSDVEEERFVGNAFVGVDNDCIVALEH